jgi:hypothetical protein
MTVTAPAMQSDAASTTDATTATTATAASRLVAALETAWTAIRARHPQVPEVVLVVAAGSDRHARGLTLGHFAAGRWELASDGDNTTVPARRPEVLVGGEGLRRGAVDVLGTLLHEAAHGLAHARGVQDTSRQGRFHNRRYAQLARELGLDVTQVDGIGWSATSVPAATADIYDEALNVLAAALTLWRRAESAGPAGPERPRNSVACVCPCGRRLRVARSTLVQAPIVCGACGAPFEPDE